MTPLLVAGQKVAVPEGQIIELYDAHGEVVRHFDVNASAKPQSKVPCQRRSPRVRDAPRQPSHARTFNTIASRRQAWAEQKSERSEINVGAGQFNLFFVIAEIGDDTEWRERFPATLKPAP